MLTRRFRLVFFGLALAILVIVGRSTTGSFSFVFSDFWFTSGLLLVILLGIIDQPHFSKDANIFVNSVAAMVSLIAVKVAARDFLWYVFLAWSLWLVLSSYLLMIVRSRPLHSETRSMQLVSRVNRQTGRPEALFSAFFLWAIFKQFRPDTEAYRALLLYWAVFILLNTRTVATAIAEVLSSRFLPAGTIDGQIIRFSSPRAIVCELNAELPLLPPGASIAIGATDCDLATASIVDDRVLNGRRFVRAAITTAGSEWARLARASAGRIRVRVISPESSSRPVAIVGMGSSIGDLKFLVNPDADLVEGEVVAVDMPDSRRAYYQIVAGVLREDSLDEASAIQDVEVTASQLGLWREERCRFEPISWVAPAGGLVFRLPSSKEVHSIPAGHLKLGVVPNSSFPVHVSLSDIVTHNTAVVGVTGSGKSYLAFWIIESLAKAGVRVLILDISRQHWIFLQHLDPFAIKTVAAVDEWLQAIPRSEFINMQARPTIQRLPLRWSSERFIILRIRRRCELVRTSRLGYVSSSKKPIH